MSTQYIRSCSINYFTQGQGSFFMKDMNGLVQKFPLLSQDHITNCYMVLVVRKGDFKLSINNFKVIEQDKTIIIIKPGDIISLQEMTSCSGTFFCFEESFFSKRYHENALRIFTFFQRNSIPYFNLEHKEMDKFDLMVHLMHGAYLTQQVNKDKMLRSYLNILLCEVEHAFSLVNGTEDIVRNVNLNSKILDFIDLVDEHYRIAKKPSFYADKLCVTPNYLNKLCKQEKGSTAGQIVRQRILIEAKRLLQFSKFNIKEIAYELRFESASYFVTFFKKLEGVTPEEYRKSLV